MANNKKIAWVTGGRGGIGSAVVKAFDNMKFDTICIGLKIREEKNYYKIDVGNSFSVKKSSKNIHIDRFPDILITCHAAPVMTWAEGIIINDLIGVHNVCSHFISKMIKNEWGRIINLTSYHSTGTYPDRMGYAAAKAGVAGYTRALALTLAKHNITCNCVSPGPVDTPRTRKFIKKGLISEDKILKRTPLRRLAQPEDIANVVAFLASDKAEFITGQEWTVDGGYTISNFPGDY